MSLDSMSRKDLVLFFIMLLKGLVNVTKSTIYTIRNLKLLGRDNSSHNISVAHSCGHGTLVGLGPKTHESRALTCTYTL